MTSHEPLVTIMIITYNHAKYIGEAIESVLNQKTNFHFNIHVIEDCSTDGTQDILREYAVKYPDRIKLFLNEKNIGFKVTQRNFIRGFKTLKAKYISILEGDDLWCYDGKLQSQIDFLEANQDFVAAAHNTVKFYDDQDNPSERFLFYSETRKEHKLSDFISMHSFFHTTTLVYRNVLKDRVPQKFINPYSCDIFNTMAHAEYGKIHYEDVDWARYRIHSGGRFSGMNPVTGWFFNIDGLRRYNAWFGYRYCGQFAESILKYCKHVSTQQKSGNCELSSFQKTKLFYLTAVYSIIRLISIFRIIPKRKDEIDPNRFNFNTIDNIEI